MSYRLTIDIDPQSERWAMLLDGDGMPLFYPTLYNTTKLRNAGKSTSTQELYLTAIKILLESCDSQGIKLTERIRSKNFLTTGELDGLSDACRRKKRGVKQSSVVSLKKGHTPPMVKVDSTTHYTYLRCIAAYLKWLCEILLGTERFTPDVNRAVEALVEGVRTRGVIGASRAGDDDTLRGMTQWQETKLFQILEPGSGMNPFTDAGVQVRNYVLAKLTALTGARGGEILNARTGDIDWESRTLSIVRRADSKQDPRRKQPRAKTNQRILPLTQETLAEIRTYIVHVRKHIPNAAAHSYLFVSHKSGPTQGQPLSLSSLQAVFATIRRTDPDLDISAHDLRHRWNWRYSETMQHQQKIGFTEAEQLRNVLAGWSPQSKMGQRYNKAYIQKKAHEAMLAVSQQREREMDELKKAKKTHG